MPALLFTWHGTSPPNLRSVFDACLKQIRNPNSTGGVALVLKGLRPARQTHRFLAGRKSPKGEIVSDGDDDTQIVSFKAVELLAWMTANKFCSVENVPDCTPDESKDAR